MGADLLKAHAQYQSPKLQAVMVQQEQREQRETIRMTVDIFADSGDRVARYIDGEKVIGDERDA
jgi:hypothetical protein